MPTEEKKKKKKKSYFMKDILYYVDNNDNVDANATWIVLLLSLFTDSSLDDNNRHGRGRLSFVSSSVNY